MNEETINSASYCSAFFVTFASARERRRQLQQHIGEKKYVRLFSNSNLNPSTLAAMEANASADHAMHVAKGCELESGPLLPVDVFQLNYGVQETTIYRIPKLGRVRFTLGPSLFGKNATVYINSPPKAATPFERTKYYKLQWSKSICNPLDESANYIDVVFHQSGTFHFYFLCEGESGNAGSGYFLVNPLLTYGPDDEVLPLDCIQCQTVLTKCMGPLSTWMDKLRVSKESGYNTIHFTPIQALGGSKSSYCLRDHRKLNPMFDSDGISHTMDDIGKLVEKLRKEWKILSITDVVLNHVACETPWILDHPECSFNLINSPHLKPAFLLDRAIQYMSIEISEGKWTARGIPPSITEEAHLEALRRALYNTVLPPLELHEFYVVDIDAIVEKFRRLVKTGGRPEIGPLPKASLKIIPDPELRRNMSTIEMDVALKRFNRNWEAGAADAPQQIERCCAELRSCLFQLNDAAKQVLLNHLHAAVENVVKGVRYLRVQEDGPKKQDVSPENPLVSRYFVIQCKVPSLEVQEMEKFMFTPNAAFAMAHNGWVMGDDPLRNFAEPGSNVYLRRELIPWGDNVKLRYGNSSKDCPFLWQYMKDYVCETAQLFHGIRLDNCHSTPLHVAEYFIDAARLIRPDLHVVAELFTSSETTDNLFVNRLGITSLIRESLSAYDCHDLGRLVHRFGGAPVGSFMPPPVRPLAPSIAHALFLDMTHDNPSPYEKRSVYDFLPSSAIVAMAGCSTGSSRGYDELVSHHIHVVEEFRQYPMWTTGTATKPCEVNKSSGIIAAKRALNELHFELGAQGFSQVYVDQVDPDTVSITRHHPVTHQSVVLVARTAFSYPKKPNETGCIPPLCIPGVIEEVIFEARVVKDPTYDKPEVRDEHYITGVHSYKLEIREHLSLYESKMVELSEASEANLQELDFTTFTPGSVIAFRISMHTSAKTAALLIRKHLAVFGYENCPEGVNPNAEDGVHTIASRLSLLDLNRVMFRVECEEQAEGRGGGTYRLPIVGSLVYCGLQGFMSVLSEIRYKNDLGHTMCDNLRVGDWMMDYITHRLVYEHSTLALSEWFNMLFTAVKKLPRYLIPCYFDAIVTGTFSILLEEIWQKMSDFVKHGPVLVRELALGSVMMGGWVPGTNLPPLSPNLTPPQPPHRINEAGKREEACTTLAAGLPHFATGYMRNWGRDTFIALRGLFLLTGRHQEARYIILAFAGCLRHGLIPNLLDKGTFARYNCRDAVWWWLQCIQEYTKDVPNGHLILKDKVSRLYPMDDSPALEPGICEMPLEEVIQEALQRHFEGVSFRERNAGPQLDQHMLDEGFNITFATNPMTGFVYGGNCHNCGTWMDKMGSSEKAGNKGKPATPRDGSAVEIVGLCKSTLRWLDKLYKDGHYPYNAVEKSDYGIKTVMTFEQWGALIKQNFETCFWIPEAGQAIAKEDPHPELVNRRGMYKDTYLASQPWTDYQMRPNFCIAMVVAPELFDADHAWAALTNVRNVLLGPFGMKTLDPSDMNYNGYYFNNNDSSDYKVAHGMNYHQGPEWLWPVGYYLRARLKFARKMGNVQALKSTLAETKEILSNNYQLVQSTPWRGLPELTNRDGDLCPDSCPVQAWSHATLLEVLYDLQQGE
ncbi:glycogen debranching enzyme-like isoform X2 [Ornithodoros turicata]|uniref:glycogen debranching enzyme-like isoform X2 n=1 Tax=Ornithodoros turicata TaxID=34597 RepID=UPI003139D92E